MSKTANYTPEMCEEIKEAYLAATDQDERDAVVVSLAEKLGRSVISIRSKLSREGVYQKKEYTTKNGSPTMSKSAMVDEIATLCGVDTPELFNSLEKANKTVLSALIYKLEKCEEKE